MLHFQKKRGNRSKKKHKIHECDTISNYMASRQRHSKLGFKQKIDKFYKLFKLLVRWYKIIFYKIGSCIFLKYFSYASKEIWSTLISRGIWFLQAEKKFSGKHKTHISNNMTRIVKLEIYLIINS